MNLLARNIIDLSLMCCGLCGVIVTICRMSINLFIRSLIYLVDERSKVDIYTSKYLTYYIIRSKHFP